MAIQFSACTRANLGNILFPSSQKKIFHFHFVSKPTRTGGNRGTRSYEIRAGTGDSYLEMWKQATERERKEMEFKRIAENSNSVENVDDDDDDDDNREVLDRKSDEFKKILEVPKEERDRIQRMQVIDRAAAAIAAAQALLKESPPLKKASDDDDDQITDSSLSDLSKTDNTGNPLEGPADGGMFVTSPKTLGPGTPGPDFWSWAPPSDGSRASGDIDSLPAAGKATPSPKPVYPVVEKERSIDSLLLPFESTLSESHNPPLPPLQSLTEVEKVDLSYPTSEVSTVGENHESDMAFSVNAAEAADALNKVDEASTEGVKDGVRWWKETGVEKRPDGVLCRWTLTRGVSADQSVEWEEKFWEAVGDFDYKELGSEKSGRDATGNVWREYWKESMWQDQSTGVTNMEKTADKWGKNGVGGEWHEKWWEHYDATGQAEKWADKYCSIDPNTPLEAGHAHVWHERWGEKYDGKGGSMKYTDKWAERSEGDGWAKWGDKWDENFDQNGHGVKQGETWWQGKYGERWNRTWGEGHNGSGWIHKYGKSSSGEHWDTHAQQDTWYERYPHFGFDHCFENSIQLREVRMPPETS